jgi:predicted Rossmann-fold nucleotide-binding protein
MKIGIFGRTKADDKEIIRKAKEIGKVIATSNHIVVTGGTEGYPHIAALSAIKAGGKAVSYAVGLSMSDHSQFHNADLSRYESVVFQRKYFDKKLLGIDNYLRSLDMCLNVDLAIVIGGRVGTMYEVAMLSGMSKDIFVLKGSGGITGQTIKKFIKEGHKEKSKIQFFEDPGILKRILVTIKE